MANSDKKVIALRPANDPGRGAAKTASEPAINLPPAVKVLCLLLIAVFCLQEFMSEEMSSLMVMTLGFIPARYSGAMEFAGSLDVAGAILAPLTYMFLHGGWLHLATNVGMLMAFGAGVEKSLGSKRFLIIYLVSGIAGAVAQFLVTPGSDMPLIGASGGVSGLFGAIVMLMHRRGFLGEGKGHRNLIATIVAFLALSVFFGFFGVPGAGGSIAWLVHIAGFFAGLGLYVALTRVEKR